MSADLGASTATATSTAGLIQVQVQVQVMQQPCPHSSLASYQCGRGKTITKQRAQLGVCLHMKPYCAVSETSHDHQPAGVCVNLIHIGAEVRQRIFPPEDKSQSHLAVAKR
jgi:hypothetical protein